MNAESVWFCVLCWIVLTGLIAGSMTLTERKQNTRRLRKQHKDEMGEQREPSGPSLTESRFRAADSRETWPPPPRRIDPQPIPPSEPEQYNPVWIIEDTLCFVIALLGSVFSWGLLAFPILLLAPSAAILTKPRRAKCAAKCAAWGAGVIALLIVVRIAQNYLTFGWTPW